MINRLSLIASLSATLCFTAAAGAAVKPSAPFRTDDWDAMPPIAAQFTGK